MKTCTFPGCNRAYNARGYCHIHYHRLMNYGSPDAPTAREQKSGIRPPDSPFLDRNAIQAAITYSIMVTITKTAEGVARPALTLSEANEVVRILHERGAKYEQIAAATGFSLLTIPEKVWRLKRKK